MAKLPQRPDPARLLALEPALFQLDAGMTLYRVYRRGGPHPSGWRNLRHFGPVARFDHQGDGEDGAPRLQERGVIYAAGDIATAMAESFQHTGRRILRAHHDPWLVGFELAEPITLLDLTDTFCVRAGASMKLASGPFAFSQRWARGFYECYPEVAGLRYPSSMTGRPTVVLYERADLDRTLSAIPLLNRPLRDPLLRDALTSVGIEIGYELV